MLQQFKQRLAPFLAWRHFPITMISAGTLLITAIIIAFLWRGSDHYVALFGSQQQIPLAQTMETLSKESINYRVHPDNGQILVEEGHFAKARMALASNGISAESPLGYQLMDHESLLGSSQFMQNVRYKRSLEGELSQSIMTLAPVAYARVHLGITEDSSFVINNVPENSASVMVRLHYGQRFSDEQVSAIIHLVAGSLPGLKPENVQLIDDKGELLSERYQTDRMLVASIRSSQELTHKIQQEIEHNIANLLLSIVGRDNFRISVMPQLDLRHIEETQERYLGNPKVNNENLNQEKLTNTLALGIPGALSNRANNEMSENNEMSGMQRSQTQRQYSHDRDIRHVRYPSYSLKNLNVAVMLNSEAEQLNEVTEQRLNQLKQMISTAAGINLARGDELNVALQVFADYKAFDEIEVKWWQDESIIGWVERIGIGLLALLLLLLGVNPLLKQVANYYASKQSLAMANNSNDEMTSTENSTTSVTAEGDNRNNSVFKQRSILPAQGSGLEEQIKHLQMLTEQESERVAEVLKQWIHNSESNSSTTSDSPANGGQ